MAVSLKTRIGLVTFADCAFVQENLDERRPIGCLESMAEWVATYPKLLKADLAAHLPGARQFLQMLSSPLPTAAIADLIAFHLLEDVPLKQSLLAEPDVRKRVVETASALAAFQPPAAAKARFTSGPSWN